MYTSKHIKERFERMCLYYLKWLTVSLHFSIKSFSALVVWNREDTSILRRGSCIAAIPRGLCPGARGRRCPPWLAAASPRPVWSSPLDPQSALSGWDGKGIECLLNCLARQMNELEVLVGRPVAAWWDWWELEMLSFISVICLPLPFHPVYLLSASLYLASSWLATLVSVSVRLAVCYYFSKCPLSSSKVKSHGPWEGQALFGVSWVDGPWEAPASGRQAPAVWGILFRYGTVRYFCKIPVYRYFSVRYKPYIFIPGFFLEIVRYFVVFLYWCN